MLHSCTPLYAGYSLHIGMNRVLPSAYDGWNGYLNGAVADAESMLDIARMNDYNITILLNEQATRARVTDELERLCEITMPGDVAFISYSGHGSSLPDTQGDESDLKDEAICLYDGMMVDDEIWSRLLMFRPRARIIMVFDCCHAGTIFRTDVMKAKAPHDYEKTVIYRAQKELYDGVPRYGPEKYQHLEAYLVSMAACQDNQYSLDGNTNGLFTGTLLNIYNNGRFEGNYYDFMKEVRELMPPFQSPRLEVVNENYNFSLGRPFTIR